MKDRSRLVVSGPVEECEQALADREHAYEKCEDALKLLAQVQGELEDRLPSSIGKLFYLILLAKLRDLLLTSITTHKH